MFQKFRVAFHQRRNLDRKDRQGTLQKQRQQEQNKQHRSKDASPDDKKVPIHDLDKRKYQSGSGILPVGKDHHYIAIHQVKQLPRWDKNGVRLRC